MKCIEYKDGFKYQIQKEYRTTTGIKPKKPIVNHKFISLDESGQIELRAGYAWDGPSGPTLDTPNFMRGSLVHDAFYQLMREGHLVSKEHRKPADRLLRIMCREDGMSPVRAWWVYTALRLMGKKATIPKPSLGIIHAPKGCPISS